MSLPKWSVNQLPAAKEWCQSVCEHAVSLRGNRSNFRRSSINVTYLTASWHSFVFYWRYIRNTAQLFAAVSLRSVRASVTFNFRSSQSVHPSVELPHQMEVYKIAYWFIFYTLLSFSRTNKSKKVMFYSKKEKSIPVLQSQSKLSEAVPPSFSLSNPSPSAWDSEDLSGPWALTQWSICDKFHLYLTAIECFSVLASLSSYAFLILSFY